MRSIDLEYNYPSPTPPHPIHHLSWPLACNALHVEKKEKWEVIGLDPLPLIAPTRVRELRCFWNAWPKSRNCTPFNCTRLGSLGKDWMMTLAPRSLDPSIFSLLEYKQCCKSPEMQNEVRGPDTYMTCFWADLTVWKALTAQRQSITVYFI